MKKEATQPQHTSALLLYSNGDKLYDGLRFIGYTNHANHIVKCCSMHDELVNSLKAIAVFVNAASKEYPTSAKATLSAIDNLIKQAEK